MSDKIKVILDCDTGSDDAMAIMLAVLSEKIDLLGVCTVAGNKEINYTTENTLAVLEALGSDVKVYKGCSKSMVATLLPSRHGSYTGMTGVKTTNTNEKGEVIAYHEDHLPLPAATRSAEPEHAVFWLIDTLLKSEGDITVIPTGPLTNIAMAMRIEPRICSKIKEIVFMGGGFKVTNATSAAEFNIWTDPEAAQIVITSGVKCTMVPLDATHQACFREKDCPDYLAIGSITAKAFVDMLRARIVAYDAYQPQPEPHVAPIHDALAVSYVIDRNVLRDVTLMRVDVDMSGGFADGQTICDTRAYPDNPKNVYVALGADNELFHEIVYTLMKKTGK